ncbi:MAG: AgmX/PglI C-terminal domain-containing protein [Candidatus Binatia bacterium]
MAKTTASVNRLRLSVLGVIGACLIGLAVLYLGIGTESPKQEANASAPSSAQLKSDKPVQAMNLALGNMVFLAREMGFLIRTNKDKPYDGNKVAARIESQLRRIRELYLQESGKDPTLVGNVLLQFDVSPTGEVSQVKELASRLKDGAFKKAIVTDVANWSFANLVSENISVTCPLLFVREGMDITTLVLWEKSLANLSGPPEPFDSVAEPPSNVAATKERVAARKEPANDAQLRYSTSLRKSPDFAATALATLNAGTSVEIIEKVDDWLKVRANADGPTGFIRKEFVTPQNVVGK